VSEITRLPTKFGQAHSDTIAALQKLTQDVIDNKVDCLVIRGLSRDESTDGEIGLNVMATGSESRGLNLMLLGLLEEAKADLVQDMMAIEEGWEPVA
jgi:hypothetical protein